MLTYSVVICTLERREDLLRCITSWLSQRPLPLEIVVVHGGSNDTLHNDTLHDDLSLFLSGTSVELHYLRMPPSLVRQRNAGIEQVKGDIVFFADDDAVYLDGYAEAVLRAYREDPAHHIGGVQGTIINAEPAYSAQCGLSRLFLLTRYDGDGKLQRSAWPAFCPASPKQIAVEVFAGAAMTFRRDVLWEFRFDEALARYWLGDDFEMAYRVSREYELAQVPDARLIHHSSPIGRDSRRRLSKMMVVNHYYLLQKCFGMNLTSWLCWAWSEIGQWLLALLWLVAGRGPAGVLGMLDGCCELFRSAIQSRRQSDRDGRSSSTTS